MITQREVLRPATVYGWGQATPQADLTPSQILFLFCERYRDGAIWIEPQEDGKHLLKADGHPGVVL